MNCWPQLEFLVVHDVDFKYPVKATFGVCDCVVQFSSFDTCVSLDDQFI